MNILIRCMYCVTHNYNDIEILRVSQSEVEGTLIEGKETNCNYIHYSAN